MSASLQIDWLKDDAARALLAEDFADFVPTEGEATVFNTPEWLLPVTHHLLGARQLLILRARMEGKLIALVPLTSGTERMAGITVRTLRYLGYPLSDRISILLSACSAASAAALVNGLLTCPEPWDLIAFDELLRPDVERLMALVAAHPHKIKTRVRHCARSPRLNVHQLESDNLNQQYSRSLRTRLSRARKKQAVGRVDIQRISGAVDACDSHLHAIAEIERVSWKGDQGVGIFAPGRSFDFFSSVSRELLAKDRLDIWEMRFNDRLIAYRWQPRFGRAVLDYNFAHLPEYDGLSPGRVLLDEIVQAAAKDAALDWVDASRGSISKPHLLRDWTSDFIDHFALWLVNTTARGALVHLLATQVNPWVKRTRAYWSTRTSPKAAPETPDGSGDLGADLR